MGYSRRDLTATQKQTLGENIRTARVERTPFKRGKDAAEKLKVARPQLSQWELGRVAIELPRLLDIAAVYQVPLDDLVYGLNAEYDAVIRQRLPLNVRRMMQAQIEAVMASGVEMAEHAPAGRDTTPSPSGPRPPAAPEKNADRRPRLRARAKSRPK